MGLLTALLIVLVTTLALIKAVRRRRAKAPTTRCNCIRATNEDEEL